MKDNRMRLRSEAFVFPLPKERIAQRPKPFEEQKLLHYDRASGQIDHNMFPDLPGLLAAGDLLVVNDSKVVPASICRSDGRTIVFLQPNHPTMTGIRAICPRRTRIGEVMELPGACFAITAREGEEGSTIFQGDLSPTAPAGSLLDYLQQKGATPIPPYIKRTPDDRDESDYQTIFAQTPGSIACPTAGLHFDDGLVAALQEEGVELASVTLHVGYGTFKPFKSEFVDEHSADAESYHVTLEAVRQIGRALREGRRVIAVGTTSTRTLESIADALLDYESVTDDLRGQTELFIYPPFDFRVISGLITNLATPRNPVMSMAAALVGLEELKGIYQAALENDYLFYTYGDGLLLL